MLGAWLLTGEAFRNLRDQGQESVTSVVPRALDVHGYMGHSTIRTVR
jgi:hypothetical protein